MERLPRDATREEVAAFFAHYGEVANVALVPDIGAFMRDAAQLRMAKAAAAEMEAARCAQPPMACGLGMAFALYVGGAGSAASALGKLQAEIGRLEQKVAAAAAQPVRCLFFSPALFRSPTAPPDSRPYPPPCSRALLRHSAARIPVGRRAWLPKYRAAMRCG